MESMKLWAHDGEAVRQAIELGAIAHIETARDILPGMNAGASTYAGPSPIKGSGTAWVLLGSWALSPARPTPIHPRRERRGFSALLVKSEPMHFCYVPSKVVC